MVVEATRLRWTGISDIREIRYHPMLTGDAAEALRTAHAQAHAIVATF